MTLFKALITNAVLILLDSNTFDCSYLLVSLKDRQSFDPALRSKGKNLFEYHLCCNCENLYKINIFIEGELFYFNQFLGNEKPEGIQRSLGYRQ